MPHVVPHITYTEIYSLVNFPHISFNSPAISPSPLIPSPLIPTPSPPPALLPFQPSHYLTHSGLFVIKDYHLDIKFL